MSGLKNYNKTNPSVTTPVDNRQVVNNTGGFVFEVDPKTRLERFLILGVDGGTYYASEENLTQQNVSWLEDLVRRDWALVLNTVLDVSVNGRAYRNGPAIFVLALVLNVGSNEAKNKVVEIAPKIARTATMAYDLAGYIENLGGWGRAKRRAIAEWFTSKTPDELAYQAVKYRQRNGWTLRDLMRLSHPVGVDQNVGNFILGKEYLTYQSPEVLAGFEIMQDASTVNSVVGILNEYTNLPWETIPTQFLKDPEIWKTLFYNGQLRGQALVRNVVKLEKLGAFKDMKFVSDFANKLTDVEMIRKTRLHPMQFALAYITYTQGQRDRSRSGWGGGRNKDWSTTARIVDALEAGFYSSFQNVQPSNKYVRIGVDVSSSMTWGFAGETDLTAAQAAGLMSMVIARTEPNYEIVGFASTLKDLGITANTSLSQAMSKVQNHNFGATNPGLLMQSAKSTGAESFIVITDNEVNSGNHPSTLLKKYRNETGINAQLIVMGMTATNFSIADPLDRGMLDVVGFDTNTPKVVSDFMSGKI